MNEEVNNVKPTIVFGIRALYESIQSNNNNNNEWCNNVRYLLCGGAPIPSVVL